MVHLFFNTKNQTSVIKKFYNFKNSVYVLLIICRFVIMKKIFIIFIYINFCIADSIILNNSSSFDGLLLGIKDNTILFKDDKSSQIIFLNTDTIKNLVLTNGDIIIDEGDIILSIQKRKEYSKKYILYEDYLNYRKNEFSEQDALVTSGCCAFILTVALISSIGNSKKGGGRSIWDIFSILGGLVND